jgi:DNA-binding response OmpR family regulator
MNDQDDIEFLRAENAWLKEQLAERDGRTGLTRDIPSTPPIYLTKREAQFLAILRRNKVVTRETAMVALYSDRADEPGSNICAVWVHNLRRKLDPLGVVIETTWGTCWQLTPESRAVLDALLNPKPEQPANS